MSAKKWLAAFVLTVILIAVLLMAFNLITDPFGVFGDRIFRWYSYDFTNNPRAAKIAYLDQNHEKYDSYIVGCSSTSSFGTDTFASYTGGKYYNMIMYGADMLDCEQTVSYLIDRYGAKRIVLNVYIDNGVYYGDEPNEYTHSMHPSVDGSNPFMYYLRFLFLNPEYGIAKIRAKINDTWLPQTFDVFDEETGEYDKRKRDVEPVSDTDRYLEAYPVFRNYPKASYTMPKIRECMESVKRITEKCRDSGVELTVVTAPVYKDYLLYFDKNDVKDFYSSLAEVTDYWDFSFSSVSCEPRFFYDETHFRNDVGKMAAARIFSDSERYVPQDFGFYVTKENASEHVRIFDDIENSSSATESVKLPVLMYHNIIEGADGGMNMTPELFEAHMSRLHEEGYNSVTLEELENYVVKGTELPEKPVLITFDDGYIGNYTYGYPILEKYGFNAVIYSIGAYVGADTYKDTGEKIYDHIDENEMLEMYSSGIMSIQSHTFDMHQAVRFEGEGCRSTMAMLDGEKEEDYIKAVHEDLSKSREMLEKATGGRIFSLSFPEGYYNDIVLVSAEDEGFTVSVSTEWGNAEIIKGLRQSLKAMKRIGASELSADALIEHIKNK